MITGEPRQMPALLDRMLTRRLPCALLATLLYTCVLWLPGLGILANLLTVALFAVICFGGGIAFAAQVGLLATIAVGLITQSWLSAATMLGLYVLLPIAAAWILVHSARVANSLRLLAVFLAAATIAFMLIGADQQGLSLEGFSQDLLNPLFESIQQGKLPPETDIAQLQAMAARVLPGATALTLWFAWLANLFLARTVALNYGFYPGKAGSLAMLRFGFAEIALLSASLAIYMTTSGNLSVASLNVAILLAGLYALQGLAITHAWASQRKLRIFLWLLYPLILMQPVMLLPLIVLGLLDTWFDFRRITHPVSGEN